MKNYRAYYIDRLCAAWDVVWGYFTCTIRGFLIGLRLKKVGKWPRVDINCTFYHLHNVSIGDYVWIGRRAFISGRGGVEIGNDVLIAFDSVIISDHHINKKGILMRKSGFTSKPVKIGNNVLIGAKAIIMPGVKIGNNVIIGASSVVTHDVPSNTVVAGIPAKKIRSRSSKK